MQNPEKKKKKKKERVHGTVVLHQRGAP